MLRVNKMTSGQGNYQEKRENKDNIRRSLSRPTSIPQTIGGTDRKTNHVSVRYDHDPPPYGYGSDVARAQGLVVAGKQSMSPSPTSSPGSPSGSKWHGSHQGIPVEAADKVGPDPRKKENDDDDVDADIQDQLRTLPNQKPLGTYDDDSAHCNYAEAFLVDPSSPLQEHDSVNESKHGDVVDEYTRDTQRYVIGYRNRFSRNADDSKDGNSGAQEDSDPSRHDSDEEDETNSAAPKKHKRISKRRGTDDQAGGDYDLEHEERADGQGQDEHQTSNAFWNLQDHPFEFASDAERKAYHKYSEDLAALAKVPIGDLRVAEDASRLWSTIRPRIDKEKETDNSQDFDFEPSYYDYTVSEDHDEGLIVRMCGITREGHSCIVRATGFNPYFFIRKPPGWSCADDLKKFIDEFKRRMKTRMKYKYDMIANPESLRKSNEQRQTRAALETGWGSSAGKAGTGSNAGFGVLDALDRRVGKPDDWRADEDARKPAVVPQPQQHPSSSSPPSLPKRRPKWVDSYDYFTKRNLPLVLTNSYNVEQMVEKGYSAFGYENTESDFVKITLAFPSLVNDAKALLSNIAGNPDGSSELTEEDWGEEDFKDDASETKKQAASRLRKEEEERTGRKAYVVAKWLDEDLVARANRHIELFDCKLDFCKRFCLDTDINPETWARIPAGKYTCVPSHAPMEGFREGAPFFAPLPGGSGSKTLTKDDITRSFYALPPQYDPDVQLQGDRSGFRRQSKAQREIAVHYKDIRPIQLEEKTGAPPVLPGDKELRDCHSRKIYLFSDIECNGRKGIFPDANYDDVMMIEGSVYVAAPGFQPTDHFVKTDQTKVDKSTAAGAEKVLTDFVFVYGNCSKVKKGSFGNQVNVYRFSSCQGLLLAFQRFLVEIDCDEISFYNGYSFDWPYMMNRAEVLGVGSLFSQLGRIRGARAWVEDCTFKSSAHGQMDSFYTHVAMRGQKDPLVLFRKLYKLRSYTLSSVSKWQLKDDKHDIDPGMISELCKTSKGMFEILKYNRQDVHLLARLTFKTELITFWLEMAVMTGLEVDKVMTRGEQVRIMSLLYGVSKERMLSGRGRFFFPLPRTGTMYAGAIVQEAATGYYRPVEDHENQDQSNLPRLPGAWKTADEDHAPCYVDGLRKAMENDGGTGIPRLEMEDLGLHPGIVSTMKNGQGQVLKNVFNENIDTKAKEKKGATTTLDFASMYPSIIQAWNLCASTILSRQRVAKLIREDGWVHGVDFVKIPDMVYNEKGNVMYTFYPDNSPIFVTSKHREALIVSVIKRLLTLRSKYKKLMEMHPEGSADWSLYNNRQLLAKIIANSCYGGFGVKAGQFPCTPVASSVTRIGRAMSTKTKCFIHHRYSVEKGYPCTPSVIYGDTDSVFMFCPGLTMLQALVFSNLVAKEMSMLHPAPNKLELEKGYAPLVLYKKKRYAGKKYVLETVFATDETGNRIKQPETNELIVKEYRLKRAPKGNEGFGSVHSSGMENTRRDSCRLVGKTLDKCTDLVFDKNDLEGAVEYTKRMISKILMDDVDLSLLITSKRLNKPADMYGPRDDTKPKREKKAAQKKKTERDKNEKKQGAAMAAATAALSGKGTFSAVPTKAIGTFFEKRETTPFDGPLGGSCGPDKQRQQQTERKPLALIPAPNDARPVLEYSGVGAKKVPLQRTKIEGFFAKTEPSRQATSITHAQKKKKKEEADAAARAAKIAKWNPPAHVSVANKRFRRDPKDKLASGDRVDYIVTADYDGKPGQPIAPFCEDPTYAYNNDIGISVDYYLYQQLKPPILRFFEPLLPHSPELEFFADLIVTDKKKNQPANEHSQYEPNDDDDEMPKKRKIDSSHLLNRVVRQRENFHKAFSSFKKMCPCLNCRRPMKAETVEIETYQPVTVGNDGTGTKRKFSSINEAIGFLVGEGDPSDDRHPGIACQINTNRVTYTKPICDDCPPLSKEEVLLKTQQTHDHLQARSNHLWSICQECLKQTDDNKQIDCVNTGCKRLWQRKKVEYDLRRSNDRIKRFTQQYDLEYTTSSTRHTRPGRDNSHATEDLDW